MFVTLNFFIIKNLKNKKKFNVETIKYWINLNQFELTREIYDPDLKLN